MGQIVVFENITLDGVMQDPIGEESVSAFDWRDNLSAAANEEWIQRIVHDTRGVQALLFGRRTYEFFASRYADGTNPRRGTHQEHPEVRPVQHIDRPVLDQHHRAQR